MPKLIDIALKTELEKCNYSKTADEIKEEIIRVNCPHWYFDNAKLDIDKRLCRNNSCRECWEREVEECRKQ